MGGLLGLGLGLSFISVIELLYFICLRGFCRPIISRSADISDSKLDLPQTNRPDITRMKNSTSSCAATNTTTTIQ